MTIGPELCYLTHEMLLIRDSKKSLLFTSLSRVNDYFCILPYKSDITPYQDNQCYRYFESRMDGEVVNLKLIRQRTTLPKDYDINFVDGCTKMYLLIFLRPW